MTADELLRDLLSQARHVSQGTAAQSPDTLAALVLQLHAHLCQGRPLPREWERWRCPACEGEGRNVHGDHSPGMRGSAASEVCPECDGTGYQERNVP